MDKQDKPTPEASLTSDKKKIGLPLVAVALDILPLVLLLLSNIPGLYSLSSTLLVATVLSPILGLTAGVFAVQRGKAVTGTFGRILAIVAICLPLLGIGCVVIFFVGAMTGLISFM